MSNQFSFIYSLHSYIPNNENSDEINVEKSSIKIEDNDEEILFFNTKNSNKNENNNNNNDIEIKRNNVIFNEGNSIDNENQDEYINLKNNSFKIEKGNISEENIINYENNNNNNKYNNQSKKILISDNIENEIENKDELQTKSNENISIEQNLLKNISSTNISPSQSIIKGKNIIHLFNYSASNKENIPFIFNLNTSDKISCNSLLESKNKTLTNKSSKSQKLGNENDYIFTEPHRLSMYNINNLLNIKMNNNNNKIKNEINQNNKINLKNNDNKNIFINKSNINITNNYLKNINKSNKENCKIESEIHSKYKELNNINGNNLLEWLNDIDLSNYYNLFIDKGVYSFDKIINDIKNEKFRVQKSDFEEIGIEKNGHIYRIITKLEIDSECIDKQIYQILTSSNYNQGRNLLISNEYCLGCCTFNENNNNNKEMIYNLDNWLKRSNLTHLKENFISNGFDRIEYFIIQMFSSYPINDNILKNELNIKNEKDRDIILYNLNREIKRILQKLNNQENIVKKYKLEFFGEDDEEEICFIF